MRNILITIVVVLVTWLSNAQAQPLTVDPESIVPLPATFDLQQPSPNVLPEFARFHGAWIGTWHDDRIYDAALIRAYYRAFKAAGGSATFELLHGVPGDGHLLRLYPDRWRPVADRFLATLAPLSRKKPLPATFSIFPGRARMINRTAQH